MHTLATCCAVLALLAVAPVSLVADTPGSPGTAPPTTTAPGFAPPLPRPLGLHRGFDPPLERWGAGHRGVDLLADVGATVLAPGGGSVSFAGDVAGRGVVTVVHAGGLRSSVEPVTATVEVGDVVGVGDVIGTIEAGPGHCAPSSCLHWGVRDAHGYVDPLLLLRRGPTVLLPGP